MFTLQELGTVLVLGTPFGGTNLDPTLEYKGLSHRVSSRTKSIIKRRASFFYYFYFFLSSSFSGSAPAKVWCVEGLKSIAFGGGGGTNST